MSDKEKDTESTLDPQALDEDGQTALELLERTFGALSTFDKVPYMKIADAVTKLVDVYGITQKAIARHFRRTQATVSYYYSMQRLIPELEAIARNEEMHFKAAIALAKMPESAQRAFLEEMGGEHITVALAEQAHKEWRNEKKSVSIGAAVSAALVNSPVTRMTEAETVVTKVYVTEDQIKSLLDLGSLTVENEGRSFELIRLADMVT